MFAPRSSRRKKRQPDESTQPNIVEHDTPDNHLLQLQSTLGNQQVMRMIEQEEAGLSATRQNELANLDQTRKDYEKAALEAVGDKVGREELVEAIEKGTDLLAHITKWLESGETAAEIDAALLNLAVSVREFVESLRDEIIAEEASLKVYEEELQKLDVEFEFRDSANGNMLMKDPISAEIEEKPAEVPEEVKDTTYESVRRDRSQQPTVQNDEKTSAIQQAIHDLIVLMNQKVMEKMEEKSDLDPLLAKAREIEDMSRVFRQNAKKSQGTSSYDSRKAALQQEHLRMKQELKEKRLDKRNEG